MNDPVSNPYSPVFYALCCKCGRSNGSTSLATGEKPFTYIGWCCQDDATRERVSRAADEAFRKLPDAEKHQYRVRMFGEAHTRQIERRALYST